ncbi:hypothetical protein CR513_27951, partial [Mucuna pruriens]
MVIYKFSIYALVLWNQYSREVKEGRRRHIDTWLDLKMEMRRRFVVDSYARNLLNRLQRMYQGSKSIENHYKVIGVALLRANTLGWSPTKPSWLGSKMYIRQLKLNLNRGGIWPQRRLTPTILPIGKGRKERRNDPRRTKVQRRGVPHCKAKKKDIHHLALVPCPKVVALSAPSAWENGTLPPNSPTKGTWLCGKMRLWRVTISRKSHHPIANVNLQGDLLMVRRLMSAHVRKESNSQRENIFHSRCHVKGKFCSIIIDDGNYVNVASLRLVKKLNLPTKFHWGYSYMLVCWEGQPRDKINVVLNSSNGRQVFSSLVVLLHYPPPPQIGI